MSQLTNEPPAAGGPRAPAGFAPYYGLVLERNQVVLRVAVALAKPDARLVAELWGRPIGTAFGHTFLELWMVTARVAARIYPIHDIEQLRKLLLDAEQAEGAVA